LPEALVFLLLWFPFHFFLLAPVLTLIHELGHAIPALALTDHDVSVSLGRVPRENLETARPTLRVGRLLLFFSPSLTRPMWGFTGSCEFHDDDQSLSRLRKALILLGGPIASLATLMALAIGLVLLPGIHLLKLFAYAACGAALVGVVITLVPVTYPRWMFDYGGLPSDGLQVMRLLASRGLDDADVTA
jgi:hypothetical protein